MNEKDRLTELIRVSLMKHVGKSCSLAENIVADLISNGVTIMSGWISVEERLPDANTTETEYEKVGVIAYANGWKHGRYRVYERARVRGKIVYRWKYAWDSISDESITHWMPLPEPPEVNK